MRCVNLIRFFSPSSLLYDQAMTLWLWGFRHCGHYSSVCLDDLNILVYAKLVILDFTKDLINQMKTFTRFIPTASCLCWSSAIEIASHLFTLIHKSVKWSQWDWPGLLRDARLFGYLEHSHCKDNNQIWKNWETSRTFHNTWNR